MIADERFYSSIVQLKIGDRSRRRRSSTTCRCIRRATLVVHVDLQRVVENEKIRIRLPIHFKGESIAPGVKTQGGVVSHMRTDVEVSCLPKDLPEFLELDLSGMSLNETLFLADIPLPPGVAIPELTQRNAGGLDPQPARRGAGAGRCRGGRRAGRGCRAGGPGAGSCAAPRGRAGCCRGGSRARRRRGEAGERRRESEKKEAAPAKKEGGKK